jgi:hypothetical protein
MQEVWASHLQKPKVLNYGGIVNPIMISGRAAPGIYTLGRRIWATLKNTYGDRRF